MYGKDDSFIRVLPPTHTNPLAVNTIVLENILTIQKMVSALSRTQNDAHGIYYTLFQFYKTIIRYGS